MARLFPLGNILGSSPKSVRGHKLLNRKRIGHLRYPARAANRFRSVTVEKEITVSMQGTAIAPRFDGIRYVGPPTIESLEVHRPNTLSEALDPTLDLARYAFPRWPDSSSTTAPSGRSTPTGHPCCAGASPAAGRGGPRVPGQRAGEPAEEPAGSRSGSGTGRCCGTRFRRAPDDADPARDRCIGSSWPAWGTSISPLTTASTTSSRR